MFKSALTGTLLGLLAVQCPRSARADLGTGTDTSQASASQNSSLIPPLSPELDACFNKAGSYLKEVLSEQYDLKDISDFESTMQEDKSSVRVWVSLSANERHAPPPPPSPITGLPTRVLPAHYIGFIQFDVRHCDPSHARARLVIVTPNPVQ